MPILTPAERLGTTIADKYRLESILGKGGMGVVFGAVHEWTGRSVAVKLLLEGLVDDPEVSSRFLQEARAAARLDHPNVVDVLDMGRDAEGNPYMVLERLSGETLGEILAREGSLDPQTAFEMLLPVMDALGEAHVLDIVHRDIKPSNIFIAEGRNGKIPKLLDFGIAKMRGEGAAWQTTTGGLLGTPYYMSPEQVRETANVGPASDVWAIGIVLYRCLSGKLPFKGDSSGAILAQILTTRPPTLDTVAPHVPPPIAHVVDVALRDNPDDRHIDMATFAEELRAAAQASGTKAVARVEGHGLRPSNTLPLDAKERLAIEHAPTTPIAGVESPPETAAPTPSLAIARAETARLAPTDGRTPTVTLDAPALDEAAAASGPEVGLSTTPFTTSTPRRVEPPRSKRLALGFVAVGLLMVFAAAGIGVYLGFSGDDREEASDRVAAAPPQEPATEVPALLPTEPELSVETLPEGVEMGTLTVIERPSCTLMVDGDRVDGADSLALAPGPHALSCRRRGETRRAEVVIVAGEVTTHTFRFRTSRGTSRNTSMAEMGAAMLDIGRDYQ